MVCVFLLVEGFSFTAAKYASIGSRCLAGKGRESKILNCRSWRSNNCFPIFGIADSSYFLETLRVLCSSAPTNSNIVYSASPITTKSMFGCIRQSAGLAEGCRPLNTVMMSLSMLFTVEATSYAGFHQPENGMCDSNEIR